MALAGCIAIDPREEGWNNVPFYVKIVFIGTHGIPNC
jgi:hypothetical protein